MRAFRAICLLFTSVSLSAATFVVPTDHEMIRRADAIVAGHVAASYPQLTPGGTVETVTEISVDDVLKGAVLAERIDVHEPGGALKDIATWIPGVPRFDDGERVLLFLTRTPQRTWAVTDIALGKFSFVTDERGHELAIRADRDVSGWNADGSPHHEPRRLAAPFVAFIRTEAAGGSGSVDYVLPDEPPRLQPAVSSKPPLKAVPLTFSAASYTGDVQNCPGSNCGSGYGARWNAFPVSLYTEPGISTTASTASSAAVTTWTNDTGSNIGYAYGGDDPCTPSCHTSGLTTADNLNTILWERDLSAYGIPAFSCSAGGASGTLGIGGVTSASSTHTGPNGETFLTNAEVDVEMNRGVLACVGTSPFTSGDLATAVTHEVGHTLGFRHADQTRKNDPAVPCSSDATLDCGDSSTAIMAAVIPLGVNGALLAWDRRAAAAVYPGGPPPAAPTGVVATATANNSVRVTWTTTTGVTYKVYRRGAGGTLTTFSPVTSPFDDGSAQTGAAYLYSVAAMNDNGTSPESAKDLATAILFTDDPICLGAGNPSPSCTAPTRVRAVHASELASAINAVCTLAGTTPLSGSPPSVNDRIGAAYITNMRAALGTARQQLSLTAIAYTDPTLYGVGNAQGQPPTRMRKAHVAELRAGVQ